MNMLLWLAPFLALNFILSILCWFNKVFNENNLTSFNEIAKVLKLTLWHTEMRLSIGRRIYSFKQTVYVSFISIVKVM